METYRETMAKLRDPDGWDVEGVIDDVARRLSDEGDGEALAVVNHLRAACRRSGNRSHGNASTTSELLW